MIRISITRSPEDVSEVMVDVLRPLSADARARLNKSLAERLAEELKDHFREKNAQPNNRGWKKSGFWGQVGNSTGVTRSDAAGAEVSIADARFRIHLHGGTIKPTGGRKFLTIPLIEEAKGLNVASYERQNNVKVFRLPGTRVLVEANDKKGTQSSVGAQTGSRFNRRSGRATVVKVAARQRLRAVYALAPQATIKPDPEALPTDADLSGALIEEASDFLSREFRNTKPTP